MIVFLSYGNNIHSTVNPESSSTSILYSTNVVEGLVKSMQRRQVDVKRHGLVPCVHWSIYPAVLFKALVLLVIKS